MLRREGATARHDDRELATLLDVPIATLHDEFVERIRALGPMDLPPLLLARPRPQDGDAPAHRPLEPLVALRLLAGTAGGLFLRAPARERRPLPLRHARCRDNSSESSTHGHPPTSLAGEGFSPEWRPFVDFHRIRLSRT